MADYQLFHADCMDILPELDGIDAVLTDPPYGGNFNMDYTRFRSTWGKSKKFIDMKMDDKPFSPGHLIHYPRCIIFGYQFMAPELPLGTILVWDKKIDSMHGTFFSDAELAWQKGGQGVYIYKHAYMGTVRESEVRNVKVHPTQKPVALMEWCLQRLKLPKGATVLDPYMGSGTVGIACAKMGYKYIGIEIDAHYFDVAKRRVSTAYGDIMPTHKDDSVGQMVLFSNE